MNNSPYTNELPIGCALICITKFTVGKVVHHGLTIRQYAGVLENDEHYVVSSLSPVDNNNLTYISFNAFEAVVKYEDFDPKDIHLHINHYLTNYKVPKDGR